MQWPMIAPGHMAREWPPVAGDDDALTASPWRPAARQGEPPPLGEAFSAVQWPGRLQTSSTNIFKFKTFSKLSIVECFELEDVASEAERVIPRESEA